MWSRPAANRCGSVLSAVSLSLGAVAPSAEASLPAPDPLINLTPPSVIGTASVGQVLTGFPGAWVGGLPLELSYQWRRCPVVGSCTDIPGATMPMYFPASGDVGLRIQLRITASNGGATEVRASEPTVAVSDEREHGATGSAPASGAGREPLIDPFPIVRIRGRYSVRWTRFTLVTVRAPVGAVIAIKCIGRECVFRNRRRTVSGRTLVRITGLERRFSPGARLVLRVTEPGRIGKYTRIAVRRGRPPARWDGCAVPASPEPVACPWA